MDDFLAIISGFLDTLTVIWSYGGALYFALMAAQYVFAGTFHKPDDWRLIVICMLFGLMLSFPRKNK